MRAGKIILLGSLMAIAAGMLWRNQPPSSNQQIASSTAANENQPSYFVNDLEIMTFNTQGQATQKLQAKKIQQFTASKETVLEQPDITLFQTDGDWRIQAKYGVLAQNTEQLFLQGNVLIDKTGSNSSAEMHMETTELTYDQTSNYAETSADVSITTGANWVTASGMQAWLQKPMHIKFPANARGHYVAN